MAQILDLGKIRFQFKGTWSSTTEYQFNDVVFYKGNGYVYISTAKTTGTLTSNTQFWGLLASGLFWEGAYSSATEYGRGSTVLYNGSIYQYINSAPSTGNVPTNTTYWNILLLQNTASANVYYVASHGADSAGQGNSLSTPYLTLKYACANVPTGSTIFVKSGTYNEQLPITVPSNVAIVGDNQRTVIIQPKSGNSDDGTTPNAQATMFYMSDGSILNKMTFKGMTGWVTGTTAQDITTSTIKGVVARLNPNITVTTKSPYILECTAIGSGCIGALVDGSVHASGYKSMIFHGYTVISDNGVGYWVKDGAKAEIVSCFTYYCYFGYACTGGGHIRALNGNNSYGTYGAYSRGFDGSETAITAQVLGSQLNFLYSGGNISAGDTCTSNSGATGIVTNVQYSANKVYLRNTTGTFTVGNTLTFTSGGTGTVTTGALEGQKGFVLVLNTLTAAPKPGQSLQLGDDSNAYVIQSYTGTYTDSNSIIVVVLAQEKTNSSPATTVVTLRSKYSQIRLTGHDFLNIGTGGITTTNYPGTPTQSPSQGNEAKQIFPGRIFYVSTDQDGNFRVGDYFKIDQGTGKATLNASAFDLAGLSSLRLGSIGAQLGESINEFSSDGTMSGNSNLAVPTEAAVITYVGIKTNSVAGPSIIYHQTSLTKTVQYDVFSAAVAGTPNYSLIGTVPSGVTINGSTGLLTIGSGTSTGTYSAFSVQAAFTTGETLKKSITLYVNAAVPVFSTANITTGIPTNTAFSSTATQATAATGTVVHTITEGALPTWATLASNGTLSGTTPSTGSGTYIGPYSFTVTATNGIYTATRSYTWLVYLGLIQGQNAYTSPGTYSWTAPSGVTSVSVVAVGGGGAGQDGWANPAGAGGGLGWKNNISVNPGQSYTVVVGSGGVSSNGNNDSLIGGNSYFNSLTTVAGYGGTNANRGVGDRGPNSNGYGGGYVGDGGGAGGNASNWTSAGGAGGYTARGYNQQETWNASLDGGGGGAYYSSTYGTGAGGGVGILGKTGYPSPGNPFYNPFQGYNNSPSTGSGGSGAHGGSNGGYGENPFSSTAQSSTNIPGGNYGGGGGGPGSGWPSASGEGGSGAVRIMWGSNRSYPNTNVADVSPSGPS